MSGIISLVTVMRARFVFSTNSRLSVRASHDCDKHEKRQVGGFLHGDFMKRCTKCGEVKPLEKFYKSKDSPDGYRWACKVCMNKSSRDYVSKNRGDVSAYHKNWKREHPEAVRENHKKYKTRNRERVLASGKAYYAKNKERISSYFRDRYEKVKDKLSEYQRRYLSVPENREKHASQTRNRRARVKWNGGEFTTKEWQDLKEFYGFSCLRCGRKEPEITLEPDHVLPVSLGGSNYISNIQPLCVSCNRKKNAKHIDYRITV